jgi:y4mF family transcriptional regulator
MHPQETGIKLKERRAILGITQKDLADISGVGLRTIKDIETGGGNPSLATLAALADVLGLELDLRIKRTVE